ncbi:hypothetical protein DBV15_09931 [Temnothorax longispinosus]|uniref:Uncharacterized protein n=1 Tax=Temnothorax longispinosus TaxID=300112 RepID=A0A4S2KH43_9HYME|nr:hypothetical protein DBV15_09931 [Temnothorax longispinosus]
MRLREKACTLQPTTRSDELSPDDARDRIGVIRIPEDLCEGNNSLILTTRVEHERQRYSAIPRSYTPRRKAASQQLPIASEFINISLSAISPKMLVRDLSNGVIFLKNNPLDNPCGG